MSNLTQLQKSIELHNTTRKWQGEGTLQYLDLIKQNIDQFDCKTMLDYGCGKGVQYTEHRIQDKLGLDLNNIYQFDPAWGPASKEPDWNKQFDCSICLDVLHFVTEEELQMIKARLEKSTSKVCIVGIQVGSPKPLSLVLKPYVLIKTAEWWQEQFANWNSGSKLILKLW
jgi:hypothetical protein